MATPTFWIILDLKKKEDSTEIAVLGLLLSGIWNLMWRKNTNGFQ